MDVLAGRMRTGLRAQQHLRAVMADAEEHAWRRRRHLRSLKTTADWQDQIERTRRAFRDSLGPLPEPAATPPRVTVTGTLERRGYIMEKLLVETQPDFFATAHLYLPADAGTSSGPGPAVLHPVGHWPLSKMQDVEQARLIGLARKGYIGLIWDPIGQGERSQYWNDARDDAWDASSTTQHASVCNPAFLIGSTVIATMLWEGIRLLDYLCSRPDVDPGRIGCTGVSGGGTYTMFLGAFDRRIRATVPVCSTSSLERMHRNGQVGEPCQNPLRAYPEMLDTADLLTAHAPAAVRIIGTRYDFFPLAGLRDAFLDVQDAYHALGIGDRVDLHVVDAHHDYNREQRELMYGWFNRWLDHDAPVAEEPFEPEPERALWCTPTGQCLTAGIGRTTPDLVRDLAQRVIPPPNLLDGPEAARREQVRVLDTARHALGQIPVDTGAEPVSLDQVEGDGVSTERLILQARMDVNLPALLFSPAGAGTSCDAPRVTAVLLDDRGKMPWSQPNGLGPELARSGIRALTVDLRGWGETAWINETFGWSQKRRHALGADNMLAYVSLMTGHSHVAQRVQDALGVVAYVRGRDGNDHKTALIGRGGGAVVALHAAALAVPGAIAGVALIEPLVSYRSAIEVARCVHPVADFVPGALLSYDLPDLLGALAPINTLVIDAEDAAGVRLTAEHATRRYQRSDTLARHLGGRLDVRVTGDSALEGAARAAETQRLTIDWLRQIADTAPRLRPDA